MPLSELDHFTRRTASHLITFYQKRLSPYKGFSCAHRVLHRGESCSQYIKRIILEHGLLRARPLIRQRFRACKAANQVLQQRRRERRLQHSPVDRVLFPSVQLATPDLAFPVFRIEGETPRGLNPEQNPLKESLHPEQAKKLEAGAKNAFSSERSQDSSCQPGSACDGLDCLDASCIGLECFPDLGELGCDLSACNTLDCNALECGVADCGSCDVGSCG